MPGTPISKGKAEEIVEMYTQGMAVAAICAELSTTPMTIYRTLYSRNVPMRGRGNREPREWKISSLPSVYEQLEQGRIERVARHERQQMERDTLRAEILLLAQAMMPATEIAASLMLRYSAVLKLLRESGFVMKRGRGLYSADDWHRVRRYIRDRFEEGSLKVDLNDIVNATGVPVTMANLVMRSELLRLELNPDTRERTLAVLPAAQLSELINEVRRRIIDDEKGETAVQLRLLHL